MSQLYVGSDGTDWSGIIPFRVHARKPELLVITYTEKGKKSIRFAGGCSAPGENPYDALGNEMTQELHLELVSHEQVRHLWTNHKVPGKHHQHFFGTHERNLQGTMRTVEIPDGKAMLGRPFWMSVEEALNKLFFSHRQGLEHALPLLAEMDQEFCEEVLRYLQP